MKLKTCLKDITFPILLAKCAHGGTQNVSESLNSKIWSRLPPQKAFVRLKTLKLGIYDAVTDYNKENVAKFLIFKVLGLRPGKKLCRIQ